LKNKYHIGKISTKTSMLLPKFAKTVKDEGNDIRIRNYWISVF